MDPHGSRDRFGPSFQHFKSSLSYLIRDTEKNLSAGVYGSTDSLAGGGVVGMQTTVPSSVPTYQLPPHAQAQRHEEEKEYLPLPSHMIGRGGGTSGKSTARSSIPPALPGSPPLSSLRTGATAEDLDAQLQFPEPASSTHHQPSAQTGTGAIHALQSHLNAQDSFQSMREQTRENAEGLLILQGTLAAFKNKMRSAFDANMLTLDKKVRLVRKDVLTHISNTVQELEKRMVDHLAKGVPGLSGQSQEEFAAAEEFKRATSEELLFLKSELNKVAFTTNERLANEERSKRARDHAFTTLQAKVDEHSSMLTDAQSGVYSGEKESLLLRAEVESLKGKLRREVTHAQSDSQAKFIELSKVITEVKKTLEGVLRREEQQDQDRTDQHTHLVSQISSASQTYIDEQFQVQAATIKQLKRAQILQQDEMDRMKRQIEQLTRGKRAVGGASVFGASVAASSGAPGSTSLEDTLDLSDETFLTKTIQSLQARVETLEKDQRTDRSVVQDRFKEFDLLRQGLSTLESESRAQNHSLSKSFREDIARVEREAGLREQQQRGWREELNAWSRNLEQSVLNLKYQLGNTTTGNLGASLNASSSFPSSSSGPGLSGVASVQGTLPTDFAPYLEHPSFTPISQALQALESRTRDRLGEVERRMEQMAETRGTAFTPSSPSHTVASSSNAPAATQQINLLDTRLDTLRTQVTALSGSFNSHVSLQGQRIEDLSRKQRELERTIQDDAFKLPQIPASQSSTTETVKPLQLTLLETKLTERMDLIHNALNEAQDTFDQTTGELDTRVQTLERSFDVYGQEISGVKEELKHVSTLTQYRMEMRDAAGASLASAVGSAAPTPTIPTAAGGHKISPSGLTPKNAPIVPKTIVGPATHSSSGSSPTQGAHVERVPDSPATGAMAGLRSPGQIGRSVAPVASKPLTPQEYSLDFVPGDVLDQSKEHPRKQIPSASTATAVGKLGGSDEFDEESEEDEEDDLSTSDAAVITQQPSQTQQPRSIPLAEPEPSPQPIVSADDASSSSRSSASDSSNPPVVTGTKTNVTQQHSTLSNLRGVPLTDEGRKLIEQEDRRRLEGLTKDIEAKWNQNDKPAAAPGSAPSSKPGSALTSPTGPSAMKQSGPPVPRHPVSGSSSALTSPLNAAGSVKPVQQGKSVTAQHPIPLSQAPEISDDSDAESSDEESSENLAAKHAARILTPKSLPTAATPTNASNAAVGKPSAGSQPPPLQSSLSPTGIGAPHTSTRPQPTDDEDSTNGVPHSILSKQVKQRYLDAEAAGQVDGEAEIDEDSLYDPEDGAGSTPRQTHSAGSARHNPPAAVPSSAQKRGLGYDEASSADDLSYSGADLDPDFDLDETLPKESDLSLNTHYRSMQHDASQLARKQYETAHAMLQQRPGTSSGRQNQQQQWDSEDDPDEDSEPEDESSGDSPSNRHQTQHTAAFPAHARAPLGASMLGPGFSPAGARKPLSNPALDKPQVAVLSPLGKGMSGQQQSQLKSNLGSVRPSSVSATPSTASSSVSSLLDKTPAFLRAPLGSPKSSPTLGHQTAPSKQSGASGSSTRTQSGSSAKMPIHRTPDEFDDDLEDDDLLSSLSTDYRRIGGASTGGHAAPGHKISSDEDLSSPRPEDLISPSRTSHTQSQQQRTQQQFRATPARSPAAQAGLRTPAGGIPQRQPGSSIHGEVDEDEMNSLFETGPAADEAGGASVASFVSELDQMDISASHDFNTSF